MTIFDVLSLIGGLSLFLFGMNLMGGALERRAGNKLKSLLGKLTTGKLIGLFTGLAVTAVIQSSSATTVMVVGFVNSGLMSLGQAINVIMGANIGTTVTAWILSLGGISGDSIWLQLLKPTSFTPILALIGIILYMFCKSSSKKDVGTIFLGFATLMFGMTAMTDSVSALETIPAFRDLFLMFKNPILGVLAGAVLTAIIQSSSASVGILQALAATGQVSFGAAIPIIMGQNIGTCITAMLSSVGTNRNARRAALVHLSFNMIGTAVWLSVFTIVDAIFAPALFDAAASYAGIATAHSAFNILCTLLLLPMTGLLEKLAYKLIPEDKAPKNTVIALDERLLATPAVALECSRALAAEMAECTQSALHESLVCLQNFDASLAESVRKKEKQTDEYEDVLGSYLVKLGTSQSSDRESAESAEILKVISDFERISDHAVNIVEIAEELRTKGLVFSEDAKKELGILCEALEEISSLSVQAFSASDMSAALCVEPLEQVVDKMKDLSRTKHITRLQQGKCQPEIAFIWSSLLIDLERIADHCSNIAGYRIETAENHMNIHETLREMKSGSESFHAQYQKYAEKYLQ